MAAGPSQRASPPCVETLPSDAHQALGILRHAHACAASLGVSPWEFAVDVASLRSEGISRTALRVLCLAGLAECRLEHLAPNAPMRTFRSLANLALPDSAGLIVTPSGLDYASKLPTPLPCPGSNGVGDAPPRLSVSRAPFWDYKQTLSWGEQIIKRLRPHAQCQRRVLSAFQEAKWAHRIDNPLSRDAGVDPKERLRQTVRHLNQHHLYQAMQFWVDEDGQGICWGPI